MTKKTSKYKINFFANLLIVCLFLLFSYNCFFVYNEFWLKIALVFVLFALIPVNLIEGSLWVQLHNNIDILENNKLRIDFLNLNIAYKEIIYLISKINVFCGISAVLMFFYSIGFSSKENSLIALCLFLCSLSLSFININLISLNLNKQNINTKE